jgi:hypothetical protein
LPAGGKNEAGAWPHNLCKLEKTNLRVKEKSNKNEQYSLPNH